MKALSCLNYENCKYYNKRGRCYPDCLDYLPVFEQQLKVCDFCLRSELEISSIQLTGDDDGLQVCIDCEPKYNKG